MKLSSPLLNKIALIVSLVLITVFAIVYSYFQWQIDQMLGGNTVKVDRSQFHVNAKHIAITNVNVLSPDATEMIKNQTVLVSGNKIEAIGTELEVPKRFLVINGNGQFLIPGFIDSHVHIKKSDNDLLLYLANGVTQVGEMTGMKHHFPLAQKIKNGALGPNIYIASPKVTSQKSFNAKLRSTFERRHQSFLTPEAGRQAVRDFQKMGYQAIKLSSDLAADIYFAINDEAKQLGIKVIGHLPVGLTLDDLYQSGQSQLAHIDSITHNLMNYFGGLTGENSQAFVDHINQQATDIAKKFKQHNIALASTIWLHQTRPRQDFDLTGFFQSIDIEYQNPGWLEGSKVSRGCLPGGNSYENPNNTAPEHIESWRKYYWAYNEANKIITNALIEQGVTIMAGTDALGACGMIPGFSLHSELEALNSVGLTNTQVLQAATRVPAQWMEIKTGIIAKGYRADLVLLDKNPLEDIRHTTAIDAVIANGNYLPRESLDMMLEQVKQANANSRNKDITPYLTKLDSALVDQ